MDIRIPVIHTDSYENTFKTLLSLIPYYTPDWNPKSGDPGISLMRIFSVMLDTVIQRLNKVPEKSSNEFLEFLDINLLPASSARVPVTFSPSAGTKTGILLPPNTQVKSGNVIFEIPKKILIAPSKLIKIFCVDPEDDSIYFSPANIETGTIVHPVHALLSCSTRKGEKQIIVNKCEGINHGDILKLGNDDIYEYNIVDSVSDNKIQFQNRIVNNYDIHNANNDEKSSIDVRKVSSFQLFKGINIQSHILYIAHQYLFNLKRKSKFYFLISGRLSVNLIFNPEYVRWEYWGEKIFSVGSIEKVETGWHPLEIRKINENVLCLLKTHPGEVLENEVNGIKSRWLRCVSLDISLTKNIIVDEIRISKGHGTGTDIEYINMPVTSVWGVGEKFGKKLRLNKVETIGDLIEFMDRPEELADILKSRKRSREYYLKYAKNIITNVREHILDSGQSKICGKGYNGTGVLHPDSVFFNDFPCEIGTDGKPKPFNPFGTSPRYLDSFYISSQECFSKKYSNISINIFLKEKGSICPGKFLSFEYWNGEGWNFISGVNDGTDGFSKDGIIQFKCPRNLKSVKINGQENYWIRFRIKDSEFGQEQYETADGNKTVKYKVPVIERIELDFVFAPQSPEHCQIFNNLEYIDISYEVKNKEKTFQPFIPVFDKQKSLYLGFNNKLEKGPLSLFLIIDDTEFQKVKENQIEWFYYSQDKDWRKLDIEDNSNSFERSGTIEFYIPVDFKQISLFGRELFWLRAVINKMKNNVTIKGIFLNTAIASQLESIHDEIVGSSDAGINQEFCLFRSPVISEKIWINESSALSGKEKKYITGNNGVDTADEIISGIENKGKSWVLWQPVYHFLNSDKESRHYKIDRASGQICFGDGKRGKIPPSGQNNIKADYSVGGGERGNVRAGEIDSVKTSIPNLDGIFNPIGAEGGSDTESSEEVHERGPHLIKHRNRAVTAEDFIRIAKEASNYVATIKSIIKENKIIIIVIPKGNDEKPTPTPELLQKIKEYIYERSLNLIQADRIIVEKPEYEEVQVKCEIFPDSLEAAITVEKAIQKKLKEFLHPISGGPDKRGWEPGCTVHISHFYSILEHIRDVDHISTLIINNHTNDYRIPGHKIACSGNHKIIVTPRGN